MPAVTSSLAFAESPGISDGVSFLMVHQLDGFRPLFNFRNNMIRVWRVVAFRKQKTKWHMLVRGAHNNQIQKTGACARFNAKVAARF